MPLLRLILLASLIVASLVALGTTAREPNPAAPSPTNASPNSRPLAIGKAGCAASGCHGRADIADGPIPVDCWKESYTRWLDRDPHSRAYAVLSNDHSQAIMRNLHQLPHNAPLTDDQQAFRDTRCLACHTNPTLAESPKDVSLDVIRKDGVSCEACHGNAERWQLAHVTWSTDEIREAELTKSGMIDLNPIAARAAECAGCHIGAKADPARGIPTRDMNHDMIAAGHPRLEFEYAQYLQALPKHWHEKHRGPAASDPGTMRPLLDWYVGRVVVEQAQCDLTLDRAKRQPWPEFADWKCTSCHRTLLTDWPPQSRQTVSRRSKPGLPPYNGFGPFAIQERFAELAYPTSEAENDLLLKNLKQLTSQMPSWSPKSVPQLTEAWLKKQHDRRELEKLDMDDTRRLNAAILSLDNARKLAGVRVTMQASQAREKVEQTSRELAQSIRELRAIQQAQFKMEDSQQLAQMFQAQMKFFQDKNQNRVAAIQKCITAFKANSAALSDMAKLIRIEQSGD